MKMYNRFPLLMRTVEVVVLFSVIFLVNTNSFIRFRQFADVKNFSGDETDFVIAVLVVVALILFLLWSNGLLEDYFAAWRNNKPLILFLVYALLSVLWSVYVPATLYKLIFLFFSTIAGAYLAVRYQIRGVITVFTWIAAICSLLSILMIIFFPLVSVMQNRSFVGSWTGIFWHRNHTGNIFAYFNMIFLIRLLWENMPSKRQKMILLGFYILSAMMVWGSRSATGIIIFLFLHFVVALIAVWLKFSNRMKPGHYYAAAALMLVGFLVFITNTEFFFGLLGRSASMTGRVPLWQDLFNNVYLEKPFFGYGYGALWMQSSFRILMQNRHNWPYQVYFADNGFFDILLNLGLVGLLVFLAVYIPLGLRGVKHVITSRAWPDFFPFLTFLYIFISNLTYSFLLEVDQLVWMLLVVMLFLTTSPTSKSIAQP